MSGSFESVGWNACVHSLDLGLYSHLKEFWGNGVRKHVNFKEKIPSTGGSEEVRTRDAATCRTTTDTLLTELLWPPYVDYADGQAERPPPGLPLPYVDCPRSQVERPPPDLPSPPLLPPPMLTVPEAK